MTRSEPFKIKEVKHLPTVKPHERWNILKRAGFNTANVSSSHVAFDLVASGISSWSQDQKAGYMIGDEAYAGSRNYNRLLEVARSVLGIDRLVPTHNGIGAEKLLVTTMMQPGQSVLHNRGRSAPLVLFNGGKGIDVTSSLAREYDAPEKFGADLDLDRVKELLRDDRQSVAYIHVELCPDGWNSQPVSYSNLEALSEIASKRQVPLAVDISNVLENALWINRVNNFADFMETVR
jgi:tryptophanase